MKAKITKSLYSKVLLLTGLCFLHAGILQAQVSITSLTPYTQNFSSLTQSANGTTWTDNATITGWYTSNGPSTTIKASSGSDVTAGLKSYGSANSSDRALGNVAASQNGDFYFGLRLKNNTSHVIRDLQVSYRLETWRTQNNKKTDVKFSYRKGNPVTSLTAGNWTNHNPLDINTDKGTATGTVNGNASPNFYTVSALISDIELAAGQEIMLRWNDADNNTIFLALDDVAITPRNTERVFYNRSGGNITNLSGWTIQPDGSSGTSPDNFSSSYQTFRLVNQAAPTLNSAWAVSGEASKVVVGDGTNAVNFTIPAAHAFNGTIDVANNATLTINHATVPVLGTLGTGSTVLYNSSFLQNLAAGSYGNLVITGSGNKILGANTIINTALVLTNKTLELGNFDLEISPGAIISGADSSAYLITNGTGQLKRRVANNNVPVLFPVGTTTYAPVTITQSTAGITDIFGVKALNNIYDFYVDDTPVGDIITNEVVNHTWLVNEAVAGGSDVSLTVQWHSSAAAADFDLNAAFLSHFYDGGWDTAPVTAVQKTGNYYQMSRSGIDTFSPFGSFSGGGFGGGMGPLPVNLLSFGASRENQAVICTWETAQEQNNAYFTIERSVDGRKFFPIGEIKGAGTTMQQIRYTFTDFQAPASTVYYRLRQTDTNGESEYFKIVTVKSAANTRAVFTLSPNPASGKRFLQAAGITGKSAEILVTTYGGEIIKQYSAKPEQLQANFEIDLEGQPKGIYLIRIITGINSYMLKTVQL